MTESARQSTDNLHSEVLPQFYCAKVGRNDEVELHRTKPKTTGFLQTMLSQRAADSPPPPAFGHNECRVRHMRASAGVVRMQGVAAFDPAVVLENKYVRLALKPVSQRVLARDISVEWISFARHDHFSENFPDRGAI
jgi:hypothetical protein